LCDASYPAITYWKI